MNIIIGKEFSNKVVPLVENAKRSISIIVYDWRWYPDQVGSAIQKFNNAILVSARKGKDVRVITNRPVESIVLEDFGIKIKKISTKRTLHTKLMIIDNEIAILGSHNYTMSAFTINHEVSLIIKNKEAVERLILYFNNLWSL